MDKNDQEEKDNTCIYLWAILNGIILIYGVVVFFYIKFCNKKKLYNINVIIYYIINL